MGKGRGLVVLATGGLSKAPVPALQEPECQQLSREPTGSVWDRLRPGEWSVHV